MITKTQKSSTVLVVYNNKVLLLKRGITAPWNPCKYGLPGGGVENNESLKNAALRELYEETGIVASEDQLAPLNINYHNGYSKIVFLYQPSHIPSVNLNYEHEHYLWASYSDCLGLSMKKLLVTRLMATINHIYKSRILT